MATGCGARGCTGVGRGRLAEDEELDEGEEDQSEEELAEDEAAGEGPGGLGGLGGWETLVFVRVWSIGEMRTYIDTPAASPWTCLSTRRGQQRKKSMHLF